MGNEIVGNSAVTTAPAVAKTPVAKVPVVANVPVAGGSSKKWIYWTVGAVVVIAVGIAVWMILR